MLLGVKQYILHFYVMIN